MRYLTYTLRHNKIRKLTNPILEKTYINAAEPQSIGEMRNKRPTDNALTIAENALN